MVHAKRAFKSKSDKRVNTVNGRGSRKPISLPSKTGNLNSFSNGMKAQEVSDRVGGTEDSASDGEGDGFVSESSSSDEDADVSQTSLPYTSLLKALNSSFRKGEPQRKRRRLDQSSKVQTSGLEGREPNGTQTIDGPISDSVAENDTLSEAFEGDEAQDAEHDEEGGVSEDEETSSDPFTSHLSDDRLDQLNHELSSSSLQWSKVLTKPTTGWKSLSCLPERVGHAEHKSGLSQPSELFLKQKLERSYPKMRIDLHGIYGHLAGQIFNYKDMLHVERTTESASNLRQMYCLHALNHVLKTRDKVIRNNAKISKLDADEEEVEFRDQGFTRPKVLILLPTRQACVRVAESMTSILQPEQQENRKRFQDTFSLPDDLSESDKPDDFKELFSGNDDDKFMIGIKVTRKTFKFFSSFYNSDVILASPLGLHSKITSGEKKKRDWDFLSSIEVMVIDQADAILSQNWENVDTVMEHLNLEPKESHGCDFARVRRWYLDKRARFYRQTIIFSAFNAPELNTAFERSLVNVSGKVKVSKDQQEGTLLRLGVQARQTFSRFDSASPAAEPEARFKFFTSTVVPVLSRFARNGAGKLAGTLIFVPSYMDFLRVQNFFCYSNESQSVTFDPADLPCISEYASKSQNARAKSLFQSGRHPVLLYTGRAHHFYRYKLRGVRRVIMYGLPDNPTFYQELVGDYLSRSISEGRYSPDDVSVQVLFSRYDAIRLERTVGSSRFLTMIKDDGDIFEFF